MAALKKRKPPTFLWCTTRGSAVAHAFRPSALRLRFDVGILRGYDARTVCGVDGELLVEAQDPNVEPRCRTCSRIVAKCLSVAALLGGALLMLGCGAPFTDADVELYVAPDGAPVQLEASTADAEDGNVREGGLSEAAPPGADGDDEASTTLDASAGVDSAPPADAASAPDTAPPVEAGPPPALCCVTDEGSQSCDTNGGYFCGQGLGSCGFTRCSVGDPCRANQVPYPYGTVAVCP